MYPRSSYEVPPFTDYIEFEMDAVIRVSGNSFEFEGNDDWASEDGNGGDWTCFDYPQVVLAQPVDVIDSISEMIAMDVPDTPGKYRIQGFVQLVYRVSGLIEQTEQYGRRPEDNETEYLTDGVDVTYLEDESTISELSITKLSKRAR